MSGVIKYYTQQTAGLFSMELFLCADHEVSEERQQIGGLPLVDTGKSQAVFPRSVRIRKIFVTYESDAD